MAGSIEVPTVDEESVCEAERHRERVDGVGRDGGGAHKPHIQTMRAFQRAQARQQQMPRSKLCRWWSRGGMRWAQRGDTGLEERKTPLPQQAKVSLLEYDESEAPLLPECH